MRRRKNGVGEVGGRDVPAGEERSSLAGKEGWWGRTGGKSGQLRWETPVGVGGHRGARWMTGWRALERGRIGDPDRGGGRRRG